MFFKNPEKIGLKISVAKHKINKEYLLIMKYLRIKIVTKA